MICSETSNTSLSILDEVCAVRNLSVKCLKMSKDNSRAFTTFLSKNVSLTHLKLWIEQPSAVSCVQVLECLMYSKVLQCLDLRGQPITYKDGVNKAGIISRFLRQVETLRKLRMESCGIVEDTGNKYTKLTRQCKLLEIVELLSYFVCMCVYVSLNIFLKLP